MNKVKRIIGKNNLKKICGDVLDVATLVVIGDAGTGKSTVIRELGKDYDVFIERRMSGMTDELMLGIPSLTGDTFTFAKCDFIKQIKETPKEKRILLFIDEINRTKEQLRPALFELFERRIDSESYPNLHLITAINHGDDFETNWDIASDKALLSRMFLSEYSPDRNDVITYMEKNQYNKILLRAIGRLDSLTDKKVKEETEQSTNYRSWEKINNIFNKNNVENITQAIEVFGNYGEYCMNNVMLLKMTNVLSSMLRAETSVNIREIICGKEEIPQDNQFECLLAAKDFCLDDKNVEFCLENRESMLKVLSIKKEIVVSFIQEAKRKSLFNKTQLIHMIKNLDEKSKNILIKMMKS